MRFRELSVQVVKLASQSPDLSYEGNFGFLGLVLSAVPGLAQAPQHEPNEHLHSPSPSNMLHSVAQYGSKAYAKHISMRIATMLGTTLSFKINRLCLLLRIMRIVVARSW